MSLIAAEIERRGIPTVCLQPVRHVAEKVRPPRALLVPYRLGFPLGKPNDPGLQHHILQQMLALLEDESLTAPTLVEYVA